MVTRHNQLSAQHGAGLLHISTSANVIAATTPIALVLFWLGYLRLFWVEIQRGGLSDNNK
jgi:hypothetical protein